MKTQRQAVAIITARGGSKGLPRKNVAFLGGKPIIAYTIDAARRAKEVSRCIVSTEDREIKEVSMRYGAEVIDRPAALAGDDSLSSDVVRHVLNVLADEECLPEYFVLLQPTSPLRTAEHLSACLSRFFSSGARCAISVSEAEHHPYKFFVLENGYLQPFRDEKSLEMPRQLLPPVYRQNGAIYVMSSKLFLEKGCFFASPAMPFIMAAEDSIDIDNESDLHAAEMILERKWRTKAR